MGWKKKMHCMLTMFCLFCGIMEHLAEVFALPENTDPFRDASCGSLDREHIHVAEEQYKIKKKKKGRLTQ